MRSISICFLTSGLITAGTGKEDEEFFWLKPPVEFLSLLLEPGGDIPGTGSEEMSTTCKLFIDVFDVLAAVFDDVCELLPEEPEGPEEEEGAVEGKMAAERVLLSPWMWKYDIIVRFVEAAPREPVSARIKTFKGLFGMR